MTDRKTFGLWLRSKRMEKDLTLEKASERLGYTSNGILANLERGAGTLPVEKIHPISEIYEIDLVELLKQIKLYEPALYQKYTQIAKAVITHYDKSKVSHAFAFHHTPFQDSLEALGEGNQLPNNNTYVNQEETIKDTLRKMYIMSTWRQVDIPFPTDKNQLKIFNINYRKDNDPLTDNDFPYALAANG